MFVVMAVPSAPRVSNSRRGHVGACGPLRRSSVGGRRSTVSASVAGAMAQAEAPAAKPIVKGPSTPCVFCGSVASSSLSSVLNLRNRVGRFPARTPTTRD
jgi:hypothetical protein